jgi:hypothetical protein
MRPGALGRLPAIQRGAAGRENTVQTDVVHAEEALACGQHVSSLTWRVCAAYYTPLQTITKSGQESAAREKLQTPRSISAVPAITGFSQQPSRKCKSVGFDLDPVPRVSLALITEMWKKTSFTGKILQ